MNMNSQGRIRFHRTRAENCLQRLTAMVLIFTKGIVTPDLILGQAENGDWSSDIELVRVQKIWDAAPHNAFTDLEYFDGQWVCAFREGRGHVSSGDYGAVRVLVSKDATTWESAALLSIENRDVRDAKISIMPDGRLLLNSWSYQVDDPDTSRNLSQSVTWISKDLKNWDGPFEVGDPGYWIWQTSWNGSIGLGVGYHWGDQDATHLYSTSDGKSYTRHVDHLRPDRDRSNEHALVFENNGTARLLLRRDPGKESPHAHALIGTSQAPYRDWEWKKLPVRLGGPSLLSLPDGRLLTCSRRYPESTGSAWTELGWIHPETGNYTPVLKLPSGGDTSYAGLYLGGSRLFISYYSSHEAKTSIYFAEAEIHSLKPVDLGTRREIFADQELISSLKDVQHRLVSPQLAGAALTFDQPWEGVYSAYPTVIDDGEIFHLYYRGLSVARHAIETEVTCHAVSEDGIHWSRPDHNLFIHQGHSANNIILASHPACHNFAPFIDQRPGIDPQQMFKAFGGSEKSGLFLFSSPDGVHWTQHGDGPIFRDEVPRGWAFDSQNVGFWSPSEMAYLLYYRRFIDGQRRIYRVQSQDLLTWSDPEDTYANLDGEHLYTNQTQPYFRAPHIYIAFPKRFFPGKLAIDTDSAAALVSNPDYRRDTADSVFMTSRSRTRYTRQFSEGYVRPGKSARDWVSRSNAIGCGVIPSRDDPFTMYLYRLSHYGQASAHLSRYALRTDGFAALSAGARPGEVLTHPVTFSGNQLHINFETSAGGSLRVGLLDAQNPQLPIPEFSADHCLELVGNDHHRQVRWKNNPDIRALTGRPIRIRFHLQDADLFSFQFSHSE